MDYRERTKDRAWRHVRAAWRGVRPLASGRWEVLGIAQDITALVEARATPPCEGRAGPALAAAEAKGTLPRQHEPRGSARR